MSYLVDTDTCSAYLSGDPRIWQKFIQYGGRLHVSAITAAELFAWVLRANAAPARRQGVLDLLTGVTFLDVDRDVSRKFGEIRACQLDQGRFTPVLDLLIASTALVHGLAVVTHNVKDFADVPGLTVEDWLAP